MTAKLPAPTVADRLVSWFSPEAGLRRLQARAQMHVMQRNYEAAATGHRTSGWNRSRGDMNAVTKLAGAELRLHSRDLVRNNSWARRGLKKIGSHAVRHGIVPKPVGVDAEKALLAFNRWAISTQCDADGKLNFYGLQNLVMRSVAQDGEVLVRRRSRFPSDGLPLPMQLQVLEIDTLDTAKESDKGMAGGKIIQGVEFDMLGRRAAYWVFPEHPGSSTRIGLESRRIPAGEIAHVFEVERAGQVRGVSWFGSAILNLKDFDEFEDAELMKQKIAACFAGFITDVNGEAPALNAEDEDDPTIEELEPGLMTQLAPGQDVKFGNPPVTTADSFPVRQLRRIAAGIGVSYEDMTGDYERVNFSSARMAKISQQENVADWQWNMLIPQFCEPVFAWAMEAAVLAGEIREEPTAEWTVPPVPMIEPDKEGLAAGRRVRNGMATFSEVVREQGHDPEKFFAEYAADKKRLDELGIVLDSDPEKVSQAGLTQERAGAGGGEKPPGAPAPKDEKKRELMSAFLAFLDSAD